MVIELTHVYVKIGQGSQVSVSMTYKKGYTRIELDEPLVGGIFGWSIDDFELRAKDREVDQEPIYDRAKFREALYCMINAHDADMGINWDTVDFWLDELCRLEEET